MKRQSLFAYESLSAEQQKLISRAKKAYKNTICPYSKFPVGAAVLAENKKGKRRTFTGCNIENASHGCTICAERVAAIKAVSEGYTKIIFVAIYAPAAPLRGNSCGCGICRQFLSEFGLDIVLLKLRNDGKVIVKTLKQLLPNTFSPSILTGNPK